MKSESETIGWRHVRGCQGRPEASTFTWIPTWHAVHRSDPRGLLQEGRARENSLWMAAPGMLEELKEKSVRQGHTEKQGGAWNKMKFKSMRREQCEVFA